MNESTGKVIIRRDVIFNETDFGKTNTVDVVKSKDTAVIESAPEEEEIKQHEVEIRQRPTRHLSDMVLMSMLIQHHAQRMNNVIILLILLIRYLNQ